MITFLLPIWASLFTALPFGIQIVDEADGRGVPLVELRTVDQTRYYSDSQGWIAFDDPTFFGVKTYFHISSPGYAYPRDGFGNSGIQLTPEPGKRAIIKMKRLNIAQRLYRITGSGIYSDSVRLQKKLPLEKPLLNGLVLGQDSVQGIPCRGLIYWFWGDTQRASYPLGIFKTSGATSALPGTSRISVDQGIDLTYFIDKNGFSREMFPSEEEGLIWIDGLCTVQDEKQNEVLLTHYTRLKNLVTRLEHGLGMYDFQNNQFKKIRELPLKEKWRFPQGQATTIEVDGKTYLAFANPFLTVRVPRTLQAILNPDEYEAFTPLKADTPYERKNSVLEKKNGKGVYAWKKRGLPLSPLQEKELFEAGFLNEDELHFHPQAEKKRIVLHAGSVHWNSYRKKFIQIANEINGQDSMLGEVYYGEAEKPYGPWTKVIRIASHPHYSFYNPTQHPFFDASEGKIIYFQGTYSETFSDARFPTPRYDYNQLMYRLDLSDPRLHP